MPPRRLYDDTDKMTKVDAALAEGLYPTRTAAIRGVWGDGETRRLQDRFRERDLARRADLATRIAGEHAGRYPIIADGGPRARTLSVKVPDGDGHWTLIFTLRNAPDAGGLACHVTGGNGMSPWPGVWGALDALGLTLVVRRGLFETREGPSPALYALASALVAAWAAAGVAEPCIQDALAVEGARLASGMTDELDSAIDRAGIRIIASYASSSRDGVGSAALPGTSPAKRTLMATLASLAHPGLALMSEDDAATWAGRPAEVLARLHRDTRNVRDDLGREMDERDAAWLLALFGRHGIAPVPHGLAPLLVSRRGAIDPGRIVIARDAAGFVAMFDAASRLSPGDGAVVDLLLSRLEAGPDAGRPYGDVAEDLWDVAESYPDHAGLMGIAARRAGGIGPAVAAVTLGVERMCEWVATHLLVPTLAAIAVSSGQVDPEALAVHLATDPRWRSAVEDHARQVLQGGRSMATLARVALDFHLWEDADPDLGGYHASEGEVAAATRTWANTMEADAALDGLWRVARQSLAPGWRIDGRRAYADRVASLIPSLRRLPQVPTGPDGVLRGVGRLVGMGRRALGEGFELGRSETRHAIGAPSRIT